MRKNDQVICRISSTGHRRLRADGGGATTSRNASTSASEPVRLKSRAHRGHRPRRPSSVAGASSVSPPRFSRAKR